MTLISRITPTTTSATTTPLKSIITPILLSIISILFIFSISLTTIKPAMALSYHDYYGPYSDDEWVTARELFENVSEPPVIVSTPRTFGGCYIAQKTGVLLDDLDCDKVPDINDNCLGVPNPDQYDQNLNGLGDACDLVVEKIEVSPDQVVEGRSFKVTAWLMNNRAVPIKNMVLRLQIPSLNLEKVLLVDELPANKLEKYDFLLRAPACVDENQYDLVLMVEFPKSPGVKEFFYVPAKMNFLHSQTCNSFYPGGGPSVDMVDIIEQQDVDSVNGGEYPFVIKNKNSESRAYLLMPEGYETWGSVRVEPGSLIVVPAGESRQGKLVVKSKEGVEGTKAFTLVVKSKDDIQRVLLNAHIKSDDLSVPSTYTKWAYGLLFVAVLVAVVALYEALFLKKE